MDRRKKLSNEYKQGKIIGGIYRIRNTHNGMYLLDYATDLQARQNAFNFMISSGSCLDNRLKEDWIVFGGGAFTFEALEALEKKVDQTQDEFMDDLKMLKQIWSDKLGPLAKY
ncbi:MAG: GIY-YIG nuclease family protein [Dehalococcoidia bacterium]